MKTEDLNLVEKWFTDIKQLIIDRKNANGIVIKDTQSLLDEIKCKAKDCEEYIQMFKNETNNEFSAGLDEAAKEQAESFGYMSYDYEFGENVESFKAGVTYCLNKILNAIKLAYGKTSMNPFDCSKAFEELIDKLNAM